jgi:hypothetical protein
MTRTHPAALFATGALCACLTFLALGPAATDAGPEASAPPAARAGEVSFQTTVVRDGKAAAVRIHARSAAAREQSCRVQASVMRERGDPRSRVLTMPERIWSEAIALRVPARGEAVRDVPLPAGAADALAQPTPADGDGAVRVFLQPDCSAQVEVG